MLIHFIRSIIHLKIIGSSSRNIVCCMDQNNIIILRILISRNDFIIKFFQKHIIFQSAVTKLQQKFLRSARHLCVQWEFHIQHILTDTSGKCLLKNIKILKCFFLRKCEKRFLGLHLFILLIIYITPTNPGDCTVFWRKLLANFQYFFFIHICFLSSFFLCYNYVKYNIRGKRSETTDACTKIVQCPWIPTSKIP